MEEMGNRAHLFNCRVNELARVESSFLNRRRRVFTQNPVKNHFGRSQFLPQAVVDFASDPTPLFLRTFHHGNETSPRSGCPPPTHPLRCEGLAANRFSKHFAMVNMGAG